jgi:hypothetical protein
MSVSSVYRQSARPQKTVNVPPELVYAPVDRSTASAYGAVLMMFTIPILLGGAVAALVHPIAGLVALIGTGVFGWRRRKGAAAGTGEGAVLRVEDGKVHVRLYHSKDDIRFRLRHLQDVQLELRKVERLQEAGAIPGLRLANATVAGAVDHGRIVLVTRRRHILLTKSYFSNTESTEWLGKVRVFFRKHGWLPTDERGEEAGDDEVARDPGMDGPDA